MINILVHFAGSEEVIKEAQEEFNFDYYKLERMNNVYSFFIKSKVHFVAIRARIKEAPNVTIIGGWSKKGKFISLPDSTDNFTRAKFKQRMKKFIRRDENGDVVENRDYTTAELQSGVINIVFGQATREF